MKCPACKNRGFIKNEDISRPVEQLKTEKFPHATYRRYVCLQCGYKWITIEKFEREVTISLKQSVGSASRAV